MTITSPLTRRWRPGWPCDPFDILRVVRRGARDPSFRRCADGTIWRVSMTPDGAGTLRIRGRAELAEVEIEAWGPGGGWLLDRAPALLGGTDDLAGFAPSHPLVAAAWHTNPHWRVARTGLVLEALVAAVIEQKVTGQEAWRGWRLLLARFGDSAPGPAANLGLRCLPAADALARIPSWEWLRCGIDPGRARTVVRAAQVADALERTTERPVAEVEAALRSLPGVGVWTAAEVRQRAHGDADAVSFGDFHVARHVTWALTGREGSDDDLAALLAPDRPHRYRVQHVVTTRLPGRPRRGPRPAPRNHLPR